MNKLFFIMAFLLYLGLMPDIDQIQLHFSPESLQFMNICLGFIMYGVALELEMADFQALIKNPKSTLTGVFSQFFLLPFLTFLLVVILKPYPSIGLGMILVAACPGGNISNFFSLLSKGNAALSVSLTAIATLFAIVMTPLNFAFWGGMSDVTAPLLSKISLEPIDMIKTVFVLLGLPLVLGMLTAQYLPKLTKKMLKPIRILSILFFLAFIGGAFAANFDLFLKHIHLVIFVVFIHNAVALASGFGLGTIMRLSNRDRRSITIETGIQNSGLGLILIFNFFNGMGGMAMIAAWWGVWHMASGLLIGAYWNRREPDLNMVQNEVDG